MDLKGRTLCEIDEYGVETAYEYDANGEVSKKTLRHADTEEELIIETTATDLSLQQKTPFNVLTDGFDDPLGMLTERTFKGEERDGIKRADRAIRLRRSRQKDSERRKQRRRQKTC